MNVLSICNLSKSFGEQKIIKNLNLSVPEGSVFGFIGQNGAGKTTTMKMVLGLLQPDEGEIRVCNEPVRFGQTKTNQYIGYLPDVPEFYNYMTAIQYLTLCGEIVGLSKKIISQKGQRLLSLVGLDGVEKRIGGYSRGMKQRLGIAIALLNHPKLLVLSCSLMNLPVPLIRWEEKKSWIFSTKSVGQQRFCFRRIFCPMWNVFATMWHF